MPLKCFGKKTRTQGGGAANLNRKRSKVYGVRGGPSSGAKKAPTKGPYISSSRLPTHIPGINRHAECFIGSIRVFSAVRIGAKKSKTALYPSPTPLVKGMTSLSSY